ncbi:LytR/AlgR family response regulator transcription factor [Flavobacterium suncheonense]|uniref:LytTR family transcriptional regulator n=1 Tax=Flavobacterium suncheonense GH29-5 = DSM 17707 TaxID=1121899 RepID=A0A0A2M4Y0_9FLAO|nr:LytTR family DNA-binding domain-containing protein [Flavobacterium suncheonense]KGO87667.1 LytTR family transcriptional regulator [Flavobacterium suncheonense GH29-5 = DSM 17707]
MYKCAIVDDNEIDRLTVASFIKQFPELLLLKSFSNAKEAELYLAKEPIDILFLDIDMPSISGIELRKKLKNVPVCIFITSHPEFAVESFEVDALDYIIKPLKQERFSKTVNRITMYLDIKTKSSLFETTIGGDTIFLKEGRNHIKVKLHDVVYLEALKDYTLVVTAQKKYCVLSGIGKLLKEEHFKSFIRIHKGFAVQKQYVEEFDINRVVLHNKMIVPIGKSYRKKVSFLLTDALIQND